MSRMQNILDKAEREGVLRAMPPIAAPAAAAPIAPPPLSVIDQRDQRDQRDHRDHLEQVVAAPAGGRRVAPRALDPRLVTASSPIDAAVEQYSALRTRIVHADTASAVRVILVTSPGRAEGKSLTVANLGLTMAQDRQRRICIVDADLRTPKLHMLFGLPEAPGLSDVLAGRADLDEALVMLEEHDLTILRAGAAASHPADLLATSTMRRAIETLAAQFDYVLVDAPAAMPLADVGILMPLVDTILMVVRAGVTAKPAIHDAVSALDSSKLLGVVLNHV